MSEEEKEEEGTEEGTEEETEDSTEEETEEESKPDPELAKAIKRRDAALKRARDAEAKLKERDEKEKQDKEDPVKVAERKLIRAEVRTQLAGLGITDKDDHDTILEVIDLSGFTMDKNGDVDSDEVRERIEDLQRIFGAKKGAPARTPRTQTRDRGSKETNSDPDAERYKRIIGRR